MRQYSPLLKLRESLKLAYTLNGYFLKLKYIHQLILLRFLVLKYTKCDLKAKSKYNSYFS